MAKIYQDRDWLLRHYICRGKSTAAMAREAECDSTTILNWLHKLNIPIRVNSGLWQDRDWLWKHYMEQEESSYAMARKAGCNRTTILRELRKNGIPVRGYSESTFLAEKNSVIIAPNLLEFLKGEILGDGCVKMNGNRSALYAHSSAREEYLIWLSGGLNVWGIEQVGRINRYKDKRNGAIGYYYKSRSYPELVPIYKRWYPNGIKTVPRDLQLTPIMARQWYLGDGGLSDYKRKRPGIILCTDDFDKQSIDHLAEELQKQGFKTTYRPSSNRIYISVRSVPDFLSWIGPCPVPCYDYKWQYVK